jgi:hypothetical protein
VKPGKIKILRIPKRPEIDYSKAWGFLDRAYQGTPCMCGAGGCCLFQKIIYILLKYAVGTGNK